MSLVAPSGSVQYGYLNVHLKVMGPEASGAVHFRAIMFDRQKLPPREALGATSIRFCTPTHSGMNV